MMNVEQENKPNSDGINLLVSILVCYPEIGTLSFEPADDSLKMTFILGQIPEKEVFETAKDLISRSILAYHSLEGLENAEIDMKIDNYGTVAFINMIRDVDTLSKGEIALIIALMKEAFGASLIRDASSTNLEEEGIIQEDFIDNMIGNMKLNHAVEKLIGIREDGRVMVFNK